MRSFSLLRFLEFSALLPILAICLASYYKYSFYSALDLLWITSQLQISGILLHAIPVFMDMFAGFFLVTSLYLFLKNSMDLEGGVLYFGLLGFLFSIVIFSFLLLLASSGSTDNYFLDRSLFIYSFFILATAYIALDSYGFSKVVFSSICIFSFVLFPTLIDYRSSKEVKKLFSGSDSYSKVYFTEEGQKFLPTTYTSVSENGEETLNEIDWRLLELVGDKAIIIITNNVILDGVKKPQVRVIEYKLIDRIY